MKIIPAAAGAMLLAGIAVTAASCDSSSAPPAVNVTNIVPSGDGGSSVLLALAGFAAFGLLAALCVACVYAWTQRGKRIAAENAVTALTGCTVAQLGLAVAAPVSVQQLAAIAAHHRGDEVPSAQVVRQR